MFRKSTIGLSLACCLILSGCGLGLSDQGTHHSSPGNNETSQPNGSGSESDHLTVVAKANWHVADFTYTDQNGESFGLAELKGKVWLADMIFTHCTSVCPVTTAHMAQLQSKLQEQGIDVPIVSFTVDPERDTPEVLKQYGEKFNVDWRKWHFLTGYSFDEIKAFSKASFKSPVSKLAGGDDFTHSASFFLMNQNGKVMVRYDGLQPPYEQIIADVKTLKATNGKDVASTSAVKVSDEAAEAVSVKLYLAQGTDMNAVKAGQPVTFEAFVTQGGEVLSDLKNVTFMIWKKGEEKKSYDAKNQGSGIYTIDWTFEQPGTYKVMPMVTANGQSAMVTKEVTVTK
ncbi:MAG TPA: SCO family protein [Bacillales bacterium]|nr:SCO family protein [Bacillales bacterium]